MSERMTHLTSWLKDAYTHCQHGTKDWCESYLNNARDVILGQDARIASLESALASANLECEQSKKTIADLREALEEAEGALADVTLTAVSEKYGMRMMWELIGGEAYEWPDHAPKTVHAAIDRAVKHLRASRALKEQADG